MQHVKHIFELQIKNLEAITDIGVQQMYSYSILRALLQSAAMTSIDIAWSTATDEDRPTVSRYARRLMNNTDGVYGEALDHLVPIVRGNGWPSFLQGWYRDIAIDRSAVRLIVDKWVVKRNQLVHLVSSREAIESARQIIQFLPHILDVLEDAIPSSVQPHAEENPLRYVIKHPTRGILDV